MLAAQLRRGTALLPRAYVATCRSQALRALSSSVLIPTEKVVPVQQPQYARSLPAHRWKSTAPSASVEESVEAYREAYNVSETLR